MLVAAVVAPAFGGPSPLTIAKRADKRSKQALNEARKVPTVSVKVVDGPDVVAPPEDFARTKVDCPPGYRATGMAVGIGALTLVSAFSFGTGYLGAAYNTSPSQPFSWTLDVNCIGGAKKLAVASARRALRRAESRLRAAERAFLAARRAALSR